MERKELDQLAKSIAEKLAIKLKPITLLEAKEIADNFFNVAWHNPNNLFNNYKGVKEIIYADIYHESFIHIVLEKNVEIVLFFTYNNQIPEIEDYYNNKYLKKLGFTTPYSHKVFESENQDKYFAFIKC